MKPQTSVLKPLAIMLVVVGLSVILISWDYMPSGFHFTGNDNYSDTVPPKKNKTEREKKVRDLDEALEELENADLKVDIDKIKKEIDEAMKNFDGSKIKLEIEKALRDVDMKKNQAEINQSLAKIDGNKIKMEIENAIKSVDMDKIRKEIELAMKDVDMNKIKAEVEEGMKKIDLDKIKLEIDLSKMKDMELELKKIGPEIEKTIKKAKVEIEKAKAELKEYKKFVDGLEKDGLIDKKAGYKIQHKDGELFINGKKQPADVYNKYKNFLEKHQSLNINTDEDFDINID